MRENIGEIDTTGNLFCAQETCQNHVVLVFGNEGFCLCAFSMDGIPLQFELLSEEMGQQNWRDRKKERRNS